MGDLPAAQPPEHPRFGAGNWWAGHGELTRLAQQEEGYGRLPGLFYS